MIATVRALATILDPDPETDPMEHAYEADTQPPIIHPGPIIMLDEPNGARRRLAAMDLLKMAVMYLAGLALIALAMIGAGALFGALQSAIDWASVASLLHGLR